MGERADQNGLATICNEAKYVRNVASRKLLWTPTGSMCMYVDIVVVNNMVGYHGLCGQSNTWLANPWTKTLFFMTFVVECLAHRFRRCRHLWISGFDCRNSFYIVSRSGCCRTVLLSDLHNTFVLVMFSFSYDHHMWCCRILKKYIFVSLVISKYNITARTLIVWFLLEDIKWITN